MMMLCRVCAEFHDKKGAVLYRVRPDMLNRMMVDVPESIRQDPLFQMLVNDDSLEVVVSAAQKKRLEDDPGVGHDASGKAVKKETAEKTAGSASKAGDNGNGEKGKTAEQDVKG